MTTEITNHSGPPKDARTGLTPPLSKSLGLQDLGKHRAMVAIELEVLAKKMDRFGWERDRGSAAHDRLLTDWMDALQDYSLQEVQKACRAAVLANPNKVPNEGHIVAQIKAARREYLVLNPPAPEPQPDRKPVDAETANAIVASLGFAPKRFGGDA
jgi:hypothetical protein